MALRVTTQDRGEPCWLDFGKGQSEDVIAVTTAAIIAGYRGARSVRS
jgi:hypothetical protein